MRRPDGACVRARFALHGFAILCRIEKSSPLHENHAIATIARYTAARGPAHAPAGARAASCSALLLGASFFVEQIAITEGARFQTGFYAATARLAAVFIAALHVIASVAREFDDKGLDMLLALDLPRSHYVLGKLGGLSRDRGRARARRLPAALRGRRLATPARSGASRSRASSRSWSRCALFCVDHVQPDRCPPRASSSRSTCSRARSPRCA